jgi:UDP-glucose 4-epimerase
VIVRPSAVYGPTDVNGRIVQRLVEAACFNRPVRLRNPESTTLDFTYVADLAEGLLLATLSPVSGETFNVTAGQGRTLAELYGLLRARYPRMPVEVERGDDFRPRRGALDVRKAQAMLGYRPRYCLEEGLDTYLGFVTGDLEPVTAGHPRRR